MTPTDDALAELGAAFSRLGVAFGAGLAPVLRSFHESVERAVNVLRNLWCWPSTTELIDGLGITEADIRSVRYLGDGVYEVRLWNHRRLRYER